MSNTDKTQSVEETLATFEDIIAQRDLIQMDFDAKRRQIIPDDIQTELQALEEEYAPKLETAKNLIDSLKKTLQQQAKAAGVRTDGRQYQVIVQKASWQISDVEGLLEFAVKVPDVMKYIKKGEIVAKVQIMKGAK